MAESALARVRLVLDEPQDPVNIAATVRAMKNMGVTILRLVRPVEYDRSRIERVAHDTRDVAERIEHYDTLDDALGDCVFVAGFTARRRSAKWRVAAPREAAADALTHAAEHPVALLFGREDKGLSNEALDRAHVVVTIPTTEHASLNLAQAVLVALYELHLTAAIASRRVAPPRKDAPPATSAQFERLFADVERALASLDFFRTRNAELILRTVRSLSYRAAPDAREIELLRAIALETLRALDRSRTDP
ncbi:MAG TPA: TrmJ/YjtD family RNA methyltransferase [Gemmatimonadaceae bacterium]|nr:TrmJ/YjtD family RNA methyltransferase [Gemmatimonadaceae bacterium]